MYLPGVETGTGTIVKKVVSGCQSPGGQRSMVI